MKVQFGAGRVRLRVANAELDALREGEAIVASVQWPDAAWCIEVQLADALDVTAAPTCVAIALPRADVDALASRAPARDGLRYTLDLSSGPVELRFEVDLHDGRRRPR